jgi:hypothetical protein
MQRTFRTAGAAAAALMLTTASVYAQVDPLNFLKLAQPTGSGGVDAKPNVIFVVDTSNRMQRGAPTDNTDQTTSNLTSTYYDAFVYPKSGAGYESTLGVTAANTTANYRRKYVNLGFTSNGSGDKFTASTIQAVGDQDPTYSRFAAPARLSIARAAMHQAVVENKYVARFGLVQMRQKTPAMSSTALNSGPVADADITQLSPTDANSFTGRWNITRPTVAGSNGGQAAAQAVVIKADAASANSDVLNKLSVDIRGTWRGVGAAPNPLPAPLIPAGNDDANTFDTPVKFMLDDAKTEVTRLISVASDPTCRNTIVVLIVGGGEGNTSGAVNNAALGTAASGFATISGRRIPIYVIAIAPPASDVASLKAIAANSGGQYFEVTSTNITNALASPMQTATGGILAPTGTVVVPEVVKAIDTAVQHAFAAQSDYNSVPTAVSLPRPDATLPLGTVTEFQVTSPIISTVNLNLAKDITGATLPVPQPPDVKDKQGNVIPQRNNLLVTTAFRLPSFDAVMRGFRTYKAVADATQQSGWKFASDGTPLWIASTPSDPNKRNLFTAKADGTLLELTTGNAAALAPLMGLTAADAATVIAAVRSLSLGAPVDSTPAFLNPPSLDPPPDDSYPGFAAANKDRRTLIWVGTNRGFFEAIDARTGLEVWGFVPLNLLPKLRTLVDGQPVGNFDFFVDGSAKLSDVKLSGIPGCDVDHPSNCWRTHLIMGEGAGGSFYQSFDVTMPNLSACIAPDSDDQTRLLGCFSSAPPTGVSYPLITLNWEFPNYTSFDPTLSVAVHCEPATGTCDSLPYGDLGVSATPIEKTVGQTWSDPAVGQVLSTSGPYSILIGSGFLPYATQQQAYLPAASRTRGGAIAGTTFYILDAKTGTVLSSSDVGNDGVNETVNNCVSNATGCKQMKNALQTDPVATGPSDQRFITKAYIGDLDGNLWRFDISLDSSSKPTITAKSKLFSAGNDQPIFQSMATVNVGGTNQYVFMGTGSDLLPATDKNTVYKLMAVLDSGAATGTASFSRLLTKSSTLSTDERVTAFPAVAGDIVFFTTTTFKTSTPCTAPDANLYAFTFSGGAAYDTNNDGKFSTSDSVLVKTLAGTRATAPFIVDQHLVFGGGGNISMFGDPTDFNNGVGQAGVRILSWREVR